MNFSRGWNTSLAFPHLPCSVPCTQIYEKMSTEAPTIQTIPPHAPPPSGRYQYKPFPDNRSFRLLCLFPPRGDGGIECSLLIAEFPFHQAPIPYEAISYVWGDPTDKTDIICDKKSLSITVSLRDVLQRVRLADSIWFLWADGICIYLDRRRTKYLRKLRC